MATRRKAVKRKEDSYTAPLGISGFYRVNITDKKGKVKGDSGWRHNVVSNLGLANYIAYAFYSTGASTAPRVLYMNLGSLQSSHASSLVNVTGGFALGSAISCQATSHGTRPSQATGHTVRFLCTFDSGSYVQSTGNITIAGIGLFHTTNATSAMCAGSFASSTLGSNQNINATYDIVFSATAAEA